MGNVTKLSIGGYKWVKKLWKFNEDFIKNYDENSDKGYVVDVEYPKKLFNLHKDFSFLAERKLICGIQEKQKNVDHIRVKKQALNHGLKLKKVPRVIQFNQEIWMKQYIEMNTQLRKRVKNEFEKDFFKLMNNSALRKTMENVRKKRDIKLVTTDKKRKPISFRT